MKKKLIKCILIAVSISCIVSVNAYACMGARPMAMGGAFIAVADDVNTTYWNPAGLTFVFDWERGSSELAYSALLNRREELRSAFLNRREEIRYSDFVSFVAPLYLGELAEMGFGVSYVNTRNLLPAEGLQGELDWTDRWLWLSFGAELFPGFSMGVNLRKQFQEERLRVEAGESRIHRGEPFDGPAYERWEDDTFGVDIGLLGRWGMFSVGALYQDANEPEIFEDKYINNLRLGIAVRPIDEIVIAIDMHDALGETEGILNGDVSGFLNIGLEGWIGNFAVRAGAYLVDPDTWEPKKYTFGIGSRIKEWEGIFANIELNYAVAYERGLLPDTPSEDKYTHTLGFAIRFH